MLGYSTLEHFVASLAAAPRYICVCVCLLFDVIYEKELVQGHYIIHAAFRPRYIILSHRVI